MSMLQSNFLSNRIAGVKPSATKEITQLAKALKKEGKNIITLSQGEPDFPTPLHIKLAAKEAIDHNASHYTEVSGTLALREAITRKFERDNGLRFTPDQIQVGCGAKQLLYNALQATINAGDEVIIPVPAWVSYTEMVLLAGGVPVTIACSPDNGFKLTPEQLKQAITPKTKWIMLNSPSNPTGAVYSSEELSALVAVLVEAPHVWAMADDIYEKIRYGDIPFATPAVISSEIAARTLTINGVSKAYAMTGWRVGYAAGAVELIKAMNLIQSQSTSHTSSISQAAAVAALDGPMDFLSDFLTAFERRRNLVVKGLNSIKGMHCQLPEGAFYAFPDCSRFIGKCDANGHCIQDDADFVMYLLKEAEVAVVPGSAFGLPGYFRVSYATSDALLKEAMVRIARACSQLG